MRVLHWLGILSLSAAGAKASLLAQNAIAAGEHTCVIVDGGDVYCWGKNNRKQCGQSDVNDITSPTKVQGISNVIKIYASSQTTCALDQTYYMWCWGRYTGGDGGRSDISDTHVPKHMGNNQYSQLSLSNTAGCGILNDSSKRVNCWGTRYAYDSSQSNDLRKDTNDSPVVVDDYQIKAKDVSVTNQMGCLISEDSKLYCWGYNAWGQLPGFSGTVQSWARNTYPIDYRRWNAVDCGSDFCCAVETDGSVFCWGMNYDGVVNGKPDVDNAQKLGSHPITNAGTNNVYIATGFRMACALDEDWIRCWGRNVEGQMGRGDTSNYKTPHPVSNVGTDIINMAVGYKHVCVTLTNPLPEYSVKCWGLNDDHQISSSSTTHFTLPESVSQLPVVHVDAATDRPTKSPTRGPTMTPTTRPTNSPTTSPTASPTRRPTVPPTEILTSTPTGSPTAGPTTESPTTLSPTDAPSTPSPTDPGETRTPTVSPTTKSPTGSPTAGPTRSPTTAPTVRVTEAPTYPVIPCTDMWMKYSHTCAKLETGVWCWGDNEYGQTGRAASNTPSEPTLVDAFPSVSVVAVGKSHSCAVRTDDKRVYCWGSNAGLKLGSAVGSTHIPSPINVPSNLQFDEVWAGDRVSCARDTNMNLYCWGDGKAPTLTGSDVALASLGYNGGCYLKQDGKLYCWGYNSNGQVGDRSTEDKTDPVYIDMNDVTDVSCHDSHCCACVGDGSLECWGSNWYGKAGDFTDLSLNSGNMHTLPNLVSDVTCKSVHTLRHGTCVLQLDNTVKCWGNNDLGSVGDDSNFLPVRPMTVNLPYNIISLTTGKSTSCASLDYSGAGTVGGYMCWGSNQDAEIPGSEELIEKKPVSVILPETGTCDKVNQPPSNAPTKSPTVPPTAFVPAAREEIEHHFITHLGDTCGTGAELALYSGVGAIDCQAKCDAIDACVGATYDTVNLECALHDSVVLVNSLRSTCYQKSYLAPQSKYTLSTDACGENFSLLHDYTMRGRLSECKAYCNSEPDCASFSMSGEVCSFHKSQPGAPDGNNAGACYMKDTDIGGYVGASCGSRISTSAKESAHTCLAACNDEPTCYGWSFSAGSCMTYAGEGDEECVANANVYDEEIFRIAFVDAQFVAATHTSNAFYSRVREAYLLSTGLNIQIMRVHSGSVIVDYTGGNKTALTKDALRFADTMASNGDPYNLGDVVMSAWLPEAPDSAETAPPTTLGNDEQSVAAYAAGGIVGAGVVVLGLYKLRKYRTRYY